MLPVINSLVSFVIFLLFPFIIIWTFLKYSLNHLIQVGVCLITSFIYFAIILLIAGFLFKLFEKIFYKGNKILSWVLFFAISICFSAIYLYNMLTNFFVIHSSGITSNLYTILSSFCTISFSSFIISLYLKANKFIGALVDINNMAMFISIIVVLLFQNIFILKTCFSALVIIMLIIETRHISKNSNYYDYLIQEYSDRYE